MALRPLTLDDRRRLAAETQVPSQFDNPAPTYQELYAFCEALRQIRGYANLRDMILGELVPWTQKVYNLREGAQDI